MSSILPSWLGRQAQHLNSVRNAGLRAEVSVIARKEWKVAEIGGADSAKGPYKLEKKVKFLDNGFITNATGGDIWSNKLGCTFVYMEEKISGDFDIQYTIEEHTDPPTQWS